MRQHPIGTGPFKFVEFKPNESIKLVRNPDYWKSGRPYLDGIEYTIIPNRSTAILAFIAGKFDLTFPYEVTVPLIKDIKQQAPQVVCELAPANNSINLLVNRQVPPFDNSDLRRALALALDRKSFVDIQEGMIMIHPTIETLRRLRLTGMAKALEEQQGLPDCDRLSFDERLAMLVDREAVERGSIQSCRSPRYASG
jgi:ABC-type oligopeptide transport system substrate-binding subunit